MFIIVVLLFLTIDVDLHISIFTFVYLLPRGDIKLVEGENNSLKILTVLHPVDEVPADNVGLIRKWIVRTEHVSTGLLPTQNLLVALSSSDVLSIRILNEIKLYIILTELINPEKSSIKNLGSPLERVKCDIELVVSGEDHQVPHLTTVGANFLGQIVRTIVDCEAVKRAVRASVEQIKISELQSDSLSWISNELVSTFYILGISSWIGWREEFTSFISSFVFVAVYCEGAETVLAIRLSISDSYLSESLIRDELIVTHEPLLSDVGSV